MTARGRHRVGVVGLLLLAAGLSSCTSQQVTSGPAAAPVAGTEAAPSGSLAGHDREAWLARRAATLGRTVEDARKRDGDLPTDAPPAGVADDEQARAEAAAIWGSVCAACHGRTGRLDGPIQKQQPSPRTWGGIGAHMGFFFGGDRMRAGIYRTIAEGGPMRDGKPSAMPAWGTTLAREQIWALVRHIEQL